MKETGPGNDGYNCQNDPDKASVIETAGKQESCGHKERKNDGAVDDCPKVHKRRFRSCSGKLCPGLQDDQELMCRHFPA